MPPFSLIKRTQSVKPLIGPDRILTFVPQFLGAEKTGEAM